MEKYCLKWNEFEANIRESFRKMREEQRLFDVTLATDDGKQIQAHKMILSAGSNFFNDIFMKSDHNNMLIYLKGISSAELEHVTDFLYNGEAFITQEELRKFLEIAQDLQVKGLQGELQGIGRNEAENQTSSPHVNKCSEQESEGDNQEVIAGQGHESILDSLEEFADSFDTREMDGTLVKIDKSNCLVNTNDELDLKIEQIIVKNDGLWKCKECGKTAAHKSLIKQHAETHIDGVSHVCHICNKTTSTRLYLQQHIFNIHSELFSCDICGKSGMKRGAYKQHKYTYHKTLSVKY